MRAVPIATLALAALAGCRAPAAPKSPVVAADVILFTAGCPAVFKLHRDGVTLGLWYFAAADAVYADTVAAGSHEVGYSQLDALGWTLKLDRRTLTVDGPTRYRMTCAP